MSLNLNRVLLILILKPSQVFRKVIIICCVANFLLTKITSALFKFNKCIMMTSICRKILNYSCAESADIIFLMEALYSNTNL